MKERGSADQGPNLWNSNPDLLVTSNPEPLKKISESGVISPLDVIDLAFSFEDLFAVIEIFFD